MSKRDDPYIALIKFAKEQTRETGTMLYQSAFDFLTTGYPDLDTNFKHHAVEAICTTVAYADLARNVVRLRLESYFHLLEYEELEEARASSRLALRVALYAIAISGALAAGSISIQVYQLTTAARVTLSDGQIGRLLDVANAPHQVTLDQDQMEALLENGERPGNVVLDPAQLDQLIEQLR